VPPGVSDGPRGVTPHRSSALALAILIVLTAGGVFFARAIVRGQDSRLLKERANEVQLVFNSAISVVPTTLSSLGSIARDTRGLGLFTKEATEDAAASPGETFALLRREGNSFVVVAAGGRGLSAGETITGPRAAAMALAEERSALVSTAIIGAGDDRFLGFALGGPDVPRGDVMYRESALGPVTAPREVGTAPFHELDVVVYASAQPVTSQVIVATTKQLPLRGSVVRLVIPVGATRWLLMVSSRQSLVGSLASFAPWATAIAGVIGSLLIALLFEQQARRHDAALGLYLAERRIAESLQQKLLPHLPAVPGLDITSCYVPASEGQQLGGDWFDVFEVGAESTGVVIGDVMGHDINAAAGMAQLRAALRAYALVGTEPAEVISRLARLVEAFNMAALATVVYGVIGPADRDGARPFRWCNAGHPPPLLHLPGGEVAELTEGSSGVLGAPLGEDRQEGECILPPGASLVLYTDGLVERPGVPLGQSIEQLCDALREQLEDATAGDICDTILRLQPTGETRDDIALLAARVLPFENVARAEVFPSRYAVEPLRRP